MSVSMSTEADVLRCGFDVGYFDKSDIARWADRQIIATESPCNELLDLSMNRHLNPVDVMQLLRSLGSTNQTAAASTEMGFLGLLYRDQRIPAQLVIRRLFQLVLEPGLTADEESRIYFLDDGFDLAEAGTFGTMSQIESELSDFLSPYAAQLSEHYPDLIPSIR